MRSWMYFAASFCAVTMRVLAPATGVSPGWIVSAQDPRRWTERPGFADLHTPEQRCGFRQDFARQQRRQYAGGRNSVWVGYGNAVTYGQSSLESQHVGGGGIQRISQLNCGWPVCEDQSCGDGQHQLSGQFRSKWKDLLLRQHSGEHEWVRKQILKPVASHDSQPLKQRLMKKRWIPVIRGDKWPRLPPLRSSQGWEPRGLPGD